MNSAEATCVLGMHRSGTSLITKLLSLLGVSLGPPERLVAPASDNPSGFWELEPIVRLNQRVLTKMGGSWSDPPAMAPGWERGAGLEPLREQARRILDGAFASSETWAFKDPRTCLTVPFWKELLPEMRCLICARNPLDVALSLQRRDGLAREHGVFLWLRYLSDCIQHTSDQRRMLIFYEDVMAGVEQELTRLADFVGRPERGRQAQTMAAARAFIDGSLRHHQSSERDLDADEALASAHEVYAMLKRAGEIHASDIGPAIERALGAIGPVLALKRAAAAQRWRDDVGLAAAQIRALVGTERRFVLMDEAQWALHEHAADLRWVPFVEKDGAFWGPPANDEVAIGELERLRGTGARFLVVGRPAFWWLDHYVGFNEYLRASYRCVVHNEWLLAFELGR